MPCDDSPRDSEPNTGSRIVVLSMQSPKEIEDTGEVAFGDSNSIVFNNESKLIRNARVCDANLGRNLWPAILDRVADKVQEHAS